VNLLDLRSEKASQITTAHLPPVAPQPLQVARPPTQVRQQRPSLIGEGGLVRKAGLGDRSRMGHQQQRRD
jgi:lipase chaperone LimK